MVKLGFDPSGDGMTGKSRKRIGREMNRWLSRWKFRSNNRYPAIRIGGCNSG